MLINSKMGTWTYLLDKEHLPPRPEFEDNKVVMDASHPTSVEAQERGERERERERAKAAKAARAARVPDTSAV